MLRIKKEKDKNRYKSSQRLQRNYIHDRYGAQNSKFFSTRFGFSEIR